MKLSGTLFILLLLGVSCVNQTKKAPDLVSEFGKKYLQSQLLNHDYEKLFIVLNPSECGSCESEVIQFVNAVQPHFNTTIVIPDKVKISPAIQASDTVTISRRTLAQYGMLNANGSVLLFKGKECVYFAPIDILSTNKMKDQMLSLKSRRKRET